MPFKVEQVDKNMSLIEWAITIKPPVKKTDNETSKEESLKLFRYSSFVSRNFTCSLSVKYWKPGKSKGFLSLRWLGKSTSNELENEDSSEFHYLPCNIAVSVDGKKRKPLKPVWVLDKGSWKSDAHGFIISNNENGLRKMPVTFIFQIKLEPSFLRGEKAALKLLTDLYVHQVDCDVQFVFEGDCHIGGHSKILSARSQVFAALFQKKEAGPFEIENITPEIFQSLVNYIYCGRISMPLTDATAQKLYEAADKFEIEDLKEDCIDYLLSCLAQNNVNDLIIWSTQHSVEKVKNAADAFLGKEVTNPEKLNYAVTQKVPLAKEVAPVNHEASNVSSIETTPITKKSAMVPSSHPPYLIMVAEAIRTLKRKRKGCSRQAILNYIYSSFKLGVDVKMANVHLKQALKRGIAQGVLLNSTGVNGAAGSFRLFDPKRDLHTVPNNGSSEEAVPPAAKKVKLGASTTSGKKTSIVASTNKITVNKNKKSLKVLAAAKLISLKADPGELPIMPAPIVKQEVEVVMPMHTNH